MSEEQRRDGGQIVEPLRWRTVSEPEPPGYYIPGNGRCHSVELLRATARRFFGDSAVASQAAGTTTHLECAIPGRETAVPLPHDDDDLPTVDSPAAVESKDGD